MNAVMRMRKRLKIKSKRILWLLLIGCFSAVLVLFCVTAVYWQSQKEEISVCLDAGHGAHDVGAVNGERYEKDDNLRLALLVRDALEEKGVKVYMTRSDDTFLSLQERCDYANRRNCTLFVALHRNSAENGKGVEIWVQNTPGKIDWALAENILFQMEGVGISENRGVKTGYVHNPDGNYYVNAHTKMPSCLVEAGFVTSDEDNALFDENLDAYAQAIALGICETLTDMQSGVLPSEE